MSKLAAGNKVTLTGWIQWVDSNGSVCVKPDADVADITVLEEMPRVGNFVFLFKERAVGKICGINNGRYRVRFADENLCSESTCRWEFRTATDAEIDLYHLQQKEIAAKRNQESLERTLALMSASEIFDVMSKMCQTAIKKREQEKLEQEEKKHEQEEKKREQEQGEPNTAKAASQNGAATSSE